MRHFLVAIACLCAVGSPRAQSTAVDSVRAVALQFAATAHALAGTRAWGVLSSAQQRELKRHQDQWAAELATIDGAALYGIGTSPAAGWILYGAVRESIESARGLRVCRSELWLVDQLNGWPAAAEYYAAVLPLATDSQRSALLDRYRALPEAAAITIADLREGLSLGYVAPRANVERVIAQLDAMLADTSEASSLAAPIRRSSDPLFRARWQKLLTYSVFPAMRAYRDFLKDPYLARTRAEPGLAYLPNGKACYRAQLRALTTMDAAPESLVTLATAHLAAIRGELAPLGARLFAGAGAADAMRRMRTEPQFVMHDADSILAAYRDFVPVARAPLDRYFVGITDEPLDVVAIPRAQAAAAAPARYEQAPRGGGSEALLLVNAYQPGGIARMNVAMGTVHEGYPGHHWQFLAARSHATADREALEAAANSGYIEGWAIYAEVLGDEMGVYRTDIDRMGYLIHQYDVFTALQLDAGLHGLGWSRAQVIDSMTRSAGRPPVQAESYADRSAATPAQLASYAVGYLVISGLRREAEARLGPRFDVRTFHSVILDDGPMPLPMLQLKVRRWIDASAATHSTGNP